jgi:formate--tetrahydrofolate ligase
MSNDITIARGAKKLPIGQVGKRLGIEAMDLIPFGYDKAKISNHYLASLKQKKDGKLILVTAINPTPAGEGKTTTSIGLADALKRLDKKALLCLREPSLGPCFGMKGGATGGGRAQVVPMDDINLHFTGDFHAITSAHNLLAAMIDNHLHWGAESGLESTRVAWRRVLDMNDRNLRQIVTGLGGSGNGAPMESGFDITVASEIMAILCLAQDAHDLEQRLERIVVGYKRGRVPVTAKDIGAVGAIMALLRYAHAPESCADTREQSRPHPWRAVREHRPWLQLRHRHQGSAEDVGLCRHRSRASAPISAQRNSSTSNAVRPGLPRLPPCWLPLSVP